MAVEFEWRLDSRQAAAFLTARGYRTAPATLAKRDLRSVRSGRCCRSRRIWPSRVFPDASASPHALRDHYVAHFDTHAEFDSPVTGAGYWGKVARRRRASHPPLARSRPLRVSASVRQVIGMRATLSQLRPPPPHPTSLDRNNQRLARTPRRLPRVTPV